MKRAQAEATAQLHVIQTEMDALNAELALIAPNADVATARLRPDRVIRQKAHDDGNAGPVDRKRRKRSSKQPEDRIN